MQPPTRRSGAVSGWSIRLIWIGLGLLGWIGVIWLGVSLYSTDPPSAGFDLELLLEAGRHVAAGMSPYDPGLVSGVSPAAPSLFYSYPPPVAQATSLLAGVPSSVVLIAWDVAAVLGLLAVADGLRRRLAPERSRASVLLPVVALAPFVFPFVIGLLFGNADVFFPLLYGAMLLGSLVDQRAGYLRAGVALALTSLKLHPASMGLWFLGRGLRQRSSGEPPRAWAAIGAALVGVAVIVVVSLLVGGTSPWSEYVSVIRAGSGADLVDPRNAGPAAVIAGLATGDGELARLLQIPITVAALGVTLVVAVRHEDPIEGFAVATIASLVMLPVTWYHYPAALMPVAIAAMLRARDQDVRPTALLLGTALVVATIAVVWLPLLWVAVTLVLVAARVSRPVVPDVAGDRAGPQRA